MRRVPAVAAGIFTNTDAGTSSPVSASRARTRFPRRHRIVLDLGTDEGRPTAIELLSGCVFVTNVRPAALQRLGLDFEALAARNPRLVYGLLTGYGMTGPRPTVPPMTSPPSGPAPGWRIC